MKELYIEGLATHDDPKSCADDRKAVGEALTGARAGWAIEPRKQYLWGADVVVSNGRQHQLQRYCELWKNPARSKNQSMYGISLHENREIPFLPMEDGTMGRPEKAEATSLGCTRVGSLIVPYYQ